MKHAKHLLTNTSLWILKLCHCKIKKGERTICCIYFSTLWLIRNQHGDQTLKLMVFISKDHDKAGQELLVLNLHIKAKELTYSCFLKTSTVGVPGTGPTLSDGEQWRIVSLGEDQSTPWDALAWYQQEFTLLITETET